MLRLTAAPSSSRRAMISKAPGLSGSVNPSPFDPFASTHLCRTRIASAGPRFEIDTWTTGRAGVVISVMLPESSHSIGWKDSSSTDRSRRRARAMESQAAIAAIAVNRTVPTVARALTAPLFSFSHSAALSNQSTRRLSSMKDARCGNSGHDTRNEKPMSMQILVGVS